MYLFVVLDIPKELNMFLDLPPPPVCDNHGRIKSNHLVVNNTLSDQ